MKIAEEPIGIQTPSIHAECSRTSMLKIVKTKQPKRGATNEHNAQKARSNEIKNVRMEFQ